MPAWLACLAQGTCAYRFAYVYRQEDVTSSRCGTARPLLSNDTVTYSKSNAVLEILEPPAASVGLTAVWLTRAQRRNSGV